MAITRPARLTVEHGVDSFACAHASLASWLQDRALTNQAEGVSNVFVVCDDAAENPRAVVGYYALAAGSVQHSRAPGRLKRNMPNPIPVAVLGRLAVHQDYQGQGIGGGLLQDAVLRTLSTTREGLAVRAMLCHAIDEAAVKFYLHNGFQPSPIDSLTLLLPLAQLAAQMNR